MEQNQNCLPHICLLESPQMGGITTSPLHSHGSPNKGTNSQLADSPLPSRGPTNGLNCYTTRALSGVPNKGDKIRNGYLTPAFSGAHKWAELLRNPGVLGVPNKSDKIRIGYLTSAFSGAHKWEELLRNPCIIRFPKRGDKIIIGYLTPTLSGAHK